MERDRTKHCVVCGTPFQANTAQHKYCSRPCETKAYRERQGQEYTRPIFCRQCGTQFLRTAKQQAKRHCSLECAKKSARESRSRFYEKHPNIYAQYHARARQKSGPDGNMKRLLVRFPDLPRACQSCGESRVLDIAHKPGHERDGAWRSKANTTPEKIWILCPTCHALIDRNGCDPASLGLS